MRSWIKELRTYLTEKCLISIVGNKSDLNDKKVVSRHGNQQICNFFLIFFESNSNFLIDAKAYADEADAYFTETSAKKCHNINELFING